MIKENKIIITNEANQRIEVRRMNWKSTRALLRMITKVIGALYSSPETQDIVAKVTGSENIAGAVKAASGFVPRLIEVITQSDEIVVELVLASTNLKAEEFDALDIATASAVVEAAFTVNFDSELKKSWAGVVETVAALMPAKAKTNSSATSTPTS